jgi:hypothetical protein
MKRRHVTWDRVKRILTLSGRARFVGPPVKPIQGQGLVGREE